MKADKMEKKEQPEQMVKIKFKHPMRNRLITQEMYKEVEKEYVKEIEEISGRRTMLPGVETQIAAKIHAKYGLPFVFDVDQVYELPETEANHYLSFYKEVIDSEVPRFIPNADRDLHRFTDKYYYAELVA